MTFYCFFFHCTLPLITIFQLSFLEPVVFDFIFVWSNFLNCLSKSIWQNSTRGEKKNTWNVPHKYCVFCTNAKSTCNDHFWWNRWWIAIVSAPLCECVDFPFAIHIHISRNSPNSRPSELNWLEIYVRNKFYQKSHLCARFSITFYQ